MKKLPLLILAASFCAQTFSHAQTQTTATPLNTNVVKTGAQAVPTAEELTQELAGFIYACATAKPLVGWKTLTVSLDKTPAQQMSVSGYATMGNNSVKKIELCDRQQTAQALVDMLNITTKGKAIEWQSLLFRTQTNRQFEFTPLSVADVIKISESAKNTAAKP